MFETAEVGRTLSKEDFKRQEPEVHRLFLELQQRLRKSDKSLIIIVAGVEGAGKGEVVDRLNRWFDIRYVQTHAYWDETDEELQRPRFWRFWQTLPMQGMACVMFGSWYTKPIVDTVFARLDEADLDRELKRICRLERTLSDAGSIIVKLWFHLSKEIQKQRLEEEARVSNFKKSPLLEKFSRSYDAFALISERALRLTDSVSSPWHIIEATDARYRDISAGNVIINRLQECLAEDSDSTSGSKSVVAEAGSTVTQTGEALEEKSSTITELDAVDLTHALSGAEYQQRLDQQQLRLHNLAWQMHHLRRNTVIVFEGWDAAGKGSAIRRVTAAMDARLYRVIQTAAPSDEERGHHYLWRFWRHIPRAGYITIYDRSWYGRVLVERVEGIATPGEWLRSYQEINDFEEHLLNHGIALFKFWLHISNDEQLRRFKEREQNPRKQHKLTAEDWRNRESWDDYMAAVNELVAHTSTARAPWTIVSANDKKYARIQVLEAICDGLENQLIAGDLATRN